MAAWGVIVWGLVCLAQEPPVPGSAEAEAEAAIAEFKQTFYRPGTTEDVLAVAVRTLGKTAHPKTLAVLAPLITQEGVPVSSRIAAALVLAEFGKVDGTPQALIKAYQNSDKPALRAVRIRIIETLGELKADAAAGLINSAILDRDPWIARAAAKAAGRVRGASSIDPLIRRLQFVETKDGDKPASGVPDPSKEGRDTGDALDRHRKSERQVLERTLHDALQDITRLRHTCAETWSKWWTQARKDFKVPK